MRLKVPPSVALKQIDSLIESGEDGFQFTLKIWLDAHDDEVRLSEKMRKETPKIIGGSPDEIYPVITDQELKAVKEKYDSWKERCTTTLKSVFLDYTPLHIFTTADVPIRETSALYRQHKNDQKCDEISDRWRPEINVLISFYSELSKNAKSPLFYIPEKAQICFYDFVVQLTPETNEATLTEKLFEQAIGELIDDYELYEHITGEDTESGLGMDSKAKSLLKNAVDGINRKTDKYFGFPLVRQSKGKIALIPPTKRIS